MVKPKSARGGRSADRDACSLTNLTAMEQKALDLFIESLTGPTEKDFNRKFKKLVTSAAAAANAGKDEEAEQAALTMLMMAGAKALKDRRPDTELWNRVSECEGNGDWAGAERTRRELLALRKREGCAGVIAKAQCDLSRLLRLLGRLDEAWRYARAATKTAHREDLAPLTVMMLENEAQCALERKDVCRALAAAEEAVGLTKPERMQNLIRMRTLTLRADCLLETGDEAGAEGDLKAASRLESDMMFAGMGGAIAARARRQEIHAKLLIRRGALVRAAKSLKRAIALRRQSANGCCGGSPYALVLRARGLERFAEISRQLGNMAAEQEALGEAKSLRELAHLPLTSGKARKSKTSQTPRRRRLGSASAGSANSKMLLLIAALVAGMLMVAGLRSLRVVRNNEQLCVNQMQNLYSAAVSYCLENKLGPDSTLSVNDFAMYVKPGLAVCPGGSLSYPAFSVYQGPSCPNGHLYRPGAPRPLRALDPKTAGLYLNFGLTNLITPEAEASRAAIDNEAIRSGSNRTPSQMGFPR